MILDSAILQNNDRNFIISFGPQHPAAHGVFLHKMKISELVALLQVLSSRMKLTNTVIK